MISDYDDDEHFCIKCHITINGLDNYINHRKANCTKTIADIPKSPSALPPIQLLSQDESFGLKADDFFSSLELQSSNKKQAVPSPSTSGKTFSGILTRSKTSAVIHASTSTSSGNEVQQSKSGKNAWIGGHQLKELGSGDNQTKLIKAVDNLSRTACLKKDEPLASRSIVTSYNDHSDDESDEYDYDDEDDDDEEVPRNYTGGKWMPEWGYSNVPPINHTGGKWKPSKGPPQHHTKGKWKPGSLYEPNVPPPTYTKGKWKPVNPIKEPEPEQFPPAGHTKGKWKPTLQTAQEERKEHLSEEAKIKKRIIEDEDNPPFRKSNGSIQYWCNACNRLLSSKIVYERHLKSELHYKRIQHEAEFDDSTLTNTRTTHLNTNHDKETKQTKRKPVEYWPNTITIGENNKDTMKNTIANVVTAAAVTAAAQTSVTMAVPVPSAAPATTTTKAAVMNATPARSAKKRFRRKIYAKCQVCLARVTSQMMGKHLISHYHCRKGDISRPEAKQMVLDNIHTVVLQSPYQCAACNFYCNTQEYFLRHWNTREHAATLKRNGGIVTCTFCNFSCANTENETMRRHLVSQEHEEVISVINRSVPIVIKNILPIECPTCSESFALNIQLRQHCQSENHEYSNTATDEYQKKQKCNICQKIFNSIIALQRHIKIHNTKIFFCSHCNIKFNTAEEIAEHRKSKRHKYTTSAQKVKNCEYCSDSLPNVEHFRVHLQNEHPERCYCCPQCGKKFTFAQELTVHIRSKACSLIQKDDIQKQNKPHKCDRCIFGCDALSELIFHQALHEEPLRLENSKQGHYKCPLCDKYFPKTSLRYHIQNHTNEKSFQCSLCEAKFSRKNNWIYHLKKHQNKEHFRSTSSSRARNMEKNFLCATCGAKFSNNSSLKKHMVVHIGKQFKCDHPGCIHMARTPADLRIHQQSTHSTEMSFRCDRCDYRGKSKQQLKRHATVHEYVKKYKCAQCSFTCRLAFHLTRHERIHSGSKPFACPHCEYRCNNLENLRKHVLSTNKHPGKCIYECKFCEQDAQFLSNFAKDFKVHLITEHGDVFGSVTEAAGYIAGIYGSVDDATATTVVPTASTSSSIVSDVGVDGDALHKENKINPPMLESVEENETSVETLIQPQETTYENKAHQEELFPMYIIAKDEVVYVDKEAWCMVGNFDVEESGALVSFNEDTETEPLFQEHFQ